MFLNYQADQFQQGNLDWKGSLGFLRPPHLPKKFLEMVFVVWMNLLISYRIFGVGAQFIPICPPRGQVNGVLQAPLGLQVN